MNGYATGTAAYLHHSADFADVVVWDGDTGIEQMPLTERAFTTFRKAQGMRFIVLNEDAQVAPYSFGVARLFYCWREAFEYASGNHEQKFVGVFNPTYAYEYEEADADTLAMLDDASTWWQGLAAECAIIKDAHEEIEKVLHQARFSDPIHTEYETWAAAAAIYKKETDGAYVSAYKVEEWINYYGGRALDEKTFTIGVTFNGKVMKFERKGESAFKLTLA